jgi:hypothetical protein
MGLFATDASRRRKRLNRTVRSARVWPTARGRARKLTFGNRPAPATHLTRKLESTVRYLGIEVDDADASLQR